MWQQFSFGNLAGVTVPVPTTEFFPSQTHNINFDFDVDQQQQQQQQQTEIEKEEGQTCFLSFWISWIS